MSSERADRTDTEKVIVTPIDGGGFKIDLHGELGAILALVDTKRELPDAGRGGYSTKLVAGAGFEPATFRL